MKKPLFGLRACLSLALVFLINTFHSRASSENKTCTQLVYNLSIENEIEEENELLVETFLKRYKNDDSFYESAHRYFEENTELALSNPAQALDNLLKLPKQKATDTIGKNVVLTREDLEFTNELVNIDGSYDADFYYDQVTSYAAKILSLRRGDKVTFPNGKSYTLGKFLGSGNLTHVYEIKEMEDQVLRITYPKSAELDEEFDVFKNAFAYMVGYQKLSPKLNYINVSKESDFQNYHYLIVDKVESSTSGLDYLEQMFGKDLEKLRSIKANENDIMNSGLNSKVKNLLLQSLELSKQEEDIDGTKILNRYTLSNTRQFSYSEKEKSWVLMDWDLGLPDLSFYMLEKGLRSIDGITPQDVLNYVNGQRR